jgi:hypothetical protein
VKPTRRSIMKALGVFATLPIGRLLSSSIAQADGLALPLKFVGVYHPHGLSTQCYNMRDGESETSFDLSFADSSLTPFEPFKSNVIVFEGIDLGVAVVSSTSGHGAAVTLFTGSTGGGSDHSAQCESLDYYLGRTKGFGLTTPFPTLNLGVGSDGSGNGEAIAWGPGGGKIRNEINPYKVFDLVFKDITIADAGTADAGTGAAAAWARGKSALDYLKGDLDALSRRLAAPEKAKLDQHLSALRDIETRLDSANTGGGGGGGGGGCVKPSGPNPADIPTTGCPVSPCVYKWNQGDPHFDKIADAQIDLLAQAIACGSTRFATLLLDDPGAVASVDGVNFPQSNGVADAHNGIAHAYQSGTKPNGAPENDSQRVLGRLNRYYFSKVARLMQKLKDAGMLNSTLILTGTDMGNPSAHSSLEIPMVLAGGVSDTAAAGKLAFGRRMKAPDNCPSNNPWCANPLPANPMPHNRVLVSICKLFDPSIEKFGVGEDLLIKGAYPGLLAG